MEVLRQPVVRHFIRTCCDGWRRGWHERNGGNLTYRMREEEAEACSSSFCAAGKWNPLGVTAPNLADEYFLVTGSGRFFRNVPLDPVRQIGIAHISDTGDRYRIVWGLENASPTSEFPSHILNHSVRKTATGGASRVIYHAHTPALIALTYVLPLTARDFTRVLWKSATECSIVFPDGVGVVPWMVPGSAEIARASSEQMKRFEAVVWAHHGLFCAGSDLDTAFGLMDTIEKAAGIHLRALSCSGGIRQTITDENLRAIADAFGVTLNDAFLDC